jgi:TonB family protein
MVAPVLVAAPAAPLTPPSVQGSTDVPYPKGARGDAVVLLELTISKDGTVTNAVVTDGTEPFAERARQAVLAWRFTPARRGGTGFRRVEVESMSR